MNGIADAVFRAKRLGLGPLRVRRSQVYCVGTAKSGTHSIYSMFSRNVRAGHEKETLELVDVYFRWHEGHITEREFRDWIIARDRDWALEMDSSWLNILILDFLAKDFPNARFVLTIRDCYSWLNSEFKRVLHTPSEKPQRIKIRKFLYDPENKIHAPEEQGLKAADLFTLDSYLSRWAAHNDKVLAAIPRERLLIVRTEQIRQRAFEIADFAGLPRYAVRLQRTHEYRNPVQREIIREIDPNFLEKKVEQHCRPLMSRFFPEIKTLVDAKI
jgi:hypothetical protein